MKMPSRFLVVLTISALSFSNCTSANKEKQTEATNSDSKAADKNSDDAVDTPGEALDKALESISDKTETKEVVDFQKLKELMPDKVLGLSRSDLSGQKTGLSGFNMSIAEAKYSGDSKDVQISIIDAGGSTLALSGLAIWANTEMERESDEGYERTTKIKGYKGFEKYDKNNKSGQLSLLVENRFIITIQVNGLNEGDPRQVLDKIDLGKLKRL